MIYPYLVLYIRYFKETELDAYISENVKDREAAIQGACDIIAEKVSDDVDVRNKILDSMTNYGRIVTIEKKDHEDDHKVYKMYYDYSERVNTLAPHRVMAIDRGEKEKVLNVSISFNEEYIENWVCRRFIRFNNSGTSEYVRAAILDGLKRLAYPSIERMVRSALSEKAHESSIDVFSMNLEKLLLQPPMKDKVILGFDPAFRTGCKLAVIDASGKKLTVDVIYPHQPNAKVRESEQKLVQLCKEYHVNLIAIGNGTASRESEAFVANTIKKFNLPVSYTIVSEAGASVYSASKLAIEEFPDLHVEQRSAISIARRLMDPLSELIKIDPQSIGVGQYQHDLPTARLKERLDFVVEKAVNRVGVNINTASVSLLKNVAGLNNASATSIVSYREENGKIESRTQIKKIPKIGPKAFEQAAGFLRIEDGKEPLDRTSIHPESYKATKVLLKELGLDTSDLGTQKAKDVISDCDTKQLMQDTGLDSYTLKDILDAICMPLRDYRDKYDAPLLRKDVLEIEDLHINDKLEGTVRNVVDFGAFVDIGLHEDGLVHISKMSTNRVKHPSDVVSVGDIVTVWVYNIDQEKQKVQLTMVNPN
ncbi:helix-hairpin-helix domain-containing protein [uncultured Holdemanella sp.]|uniref:helix-hairpin-helix domain-containing protein n=1 Tax=uncultured Holdemanella sp. TaxID=1763549 RepID=UPI0025E0F254|nr:helix-hairpin-helix domain-containing protein [uncultured Holdemanella sp.]